MFETKKEFLELFKYKTNMSLWQKSLIASGSGWRIVGSPTGTGVPSIYEGNLEDYPTSVTLPSPNIESNLQLTFLLIQTVGELAAEIENLKAQIENRPLISSIFINDLLSEELDVRVPISVIVEETDEECVARWAEVNAFGIATTTLEAIQNLKENIVDLYHDLSSRNIDTLGEIAIVMLKVLEAHIKRKT